MFINRTQVTTSTPLSTGQFTFTNWFKIPTGKTAYFNFQGNATLGNLFVLDCFMTATTSGNISIQNSGTLVATGTHPVNAWFELKIKANFNTNTWELLIDGVSQGTWSNTANQVWGVDYYPTNATAAFWLDDVSYDIVPYTLPNLNAPANFIGITNGLVGQTSNCSVTVRNLGTTTINNFDLSVTQNAGAPVNQSVTGLTLASLATTTIVITTPFTFVSGSNTFSATVSNVNGLGADNEVIDNTVSKTVTPVNPAPGKMVMVEEATGTWCGWCVRGAVFMDLMASKYPAYFAGVAVHNSDPMVVTNYNAGMAPLISGYPSAVVDRLPSLDPSEMEQDFLDRIIVAPKATIQNGAVYNASTRELKVSLSTTIQQNITGNYKIACVLAEDSVAGTASGYNQANYYEGGGHGAMGGFESLPNPVPAAQMNYNHVGRIISPSFTGLSNAYGTNASIGQIVTYTFTFTLPNTWDDSQIHIMGLFIAPTGLIDNASSTTVTQAVTNGYVSGTEIVGITELGAMDAQLNLYPNPTSSNSTISLNLTKQSTIQVSIYAIDGTLVGTKNYGQLDGGMVLPIELSKFKSGMYFVNVIINGSTSVLKLIKE